MMLHAGATRRTTWGEALTVLIHGGVCAMPANGLRDGVPISHMARPTRQRLCGRCAYQEDVPMGCTALPPVCGTLHPRTWPGRLHLAFDSE